MRYGTALSITFKSIIGLTAFLLMIGCAGTNTISLFSYTYIQADPSVSDVPYRSQLPWIDAGRDASQGGATSEGMRPFVYLPNSIPGLSESIELPNIVPAPDSSIESVEPEEPEKESEIVSEGTLSYVVTRGPKLPEISNTTLNSAIVVDDKIVFDADISSWPIKHSNKDLSAIGYLFRLGDDGNYSGGKFEWVGAGRDYLWTHNLYKEGDQYYNPPNKGETCMFCLVSTDEKQRTNFVTIEF